jgi:putative ABC transport system ATP-binding protein
VIQDAVQLTAVSKTYGRGRTSVAALRDACLSVRPGELVAVVGPSGSGKSTLLAIVGGLLSPDSGTVYVGGVDVTALPRGQRARYRAAKVGFVFQSLNLVPFLTARENLQLMASFAGVPRSAARRRADRLLAALGLEGRERDLPGRLSGGEQQRVAIARALIHGPAVLLADEPTANLDTERGQAVVELLAREVRQRQTAGLLVTHDPRMADLADRIVQVADGRLTAGAEPVPSAGLTTTTEAE